MPLLTVAQSAKLRNVTKMSIHRWLRAGLRHQKLGSQFVIEEKDLKKFTPKDRGNPNFRRRKAKRV